MAKYDLLVRGENFLTNMDGRRQKHGFYVHVFLEAGNAHEAEYAAMDVLRKDRALKRGVLNKKSDPSIMYLEGTKRLRSFKGCRLPRTGFVWFPEKNPKRKPGRVKSKGRSTTPVD